MEAAQCRGHLMLLAELHIPEGGERHRPIHLAPDQHQRTHHGTYPMNLSHGHIHRGGEQVQRAAKARSAAFVHLPAVEEDPTREELAKPKVAREAEPAGALEDCKLSQEAVKVCVKLPRGWEQRSRSERHAGSSGARAHRQFGSI